MIGRVNVVASRYHGHVQKDRWSTIMKIEPYVEQFLLYSRYVVKRIGNDRINVNAGYLAYITLLSIVPMLTVLPVLSSFLCSKTQETLFKILSLLICARCW